MRKKIFVVLLMLSLISMNIAYADDGSRVYTTQINEYEYVKQLKNRTDAELKQMGFGEHEIYSLRKLDFKQAIKERAKLSNEELESLGYNTKQIYELKNFTGTEDEIKTLSATLTTYLYVGASGKSSYYSWLTMRYGFEWSSMPFWLITDSIALAWSDGMKTNASGSSFTLHYVNPSYNWSPPTQIIPASGVYAKWGVTDEVMHSWAKSGDGVHAINKYDYVNDVEIILKFGHAVILTSISVDINGTPSINFGVGVQELGYKYLRHYL